MHQLTGFQRDVLTVVSGLDSPNGLDIKAELDEYYQSEINHGRLYPNLDKLVDEELLEKGKRNDRANTYGVTARGRRMLDARREWESRYVDGRIKV